MASTHEYDVRGAAEMVARHTRWVHIDESAVAAWAAAVNPADVRPAARPPELAFAGEPEQVARWVLMLDCLNFCFWTQTPPEWVVHHQGREWRRYGALVAALHRGVCQDAGWLDARRWASVEREQVQVLLAGTGTIPLFAERVRMLRETGRVLLDRWAGSAGAIANDGVYDAARIAATVADAFPSFRDVHSYAGLRVPILKRAQIFAADLAAAWAATGGPAIRGLEKLTAFADYRVPQMLRHLHILTLEPQLEARIEAGGLLESGGEQEVELRTSSIWAVECMCRALRLRGAEVPAWRLDEYLWEHSHDPQVRLQHHRTLTIYY